MDPNPTLDYLISNLEEGDTEAAAENARWLAQWLNRGGFAPTIKPDALEFLMSTLADLLERSR